MSIIRRKNFGRGMVVAISTILTIILAYLILKDLVSFESLYNNKVILLLWINERFFLSLFIFCFFYICVVTFSLPFATILTVSGGMFFGVPLGSLLSALSATFGSVILFLIVRAGFEKSLHVKLNENKNFQTVKEGIERNVWSYLFLIRLVPIIPFWIANIAPAFLGVRVSIFFITTFLGILPATMMYSYIGSSLESSYGGNSPDLSLFSRLEFLIPVSGLAILSLIPLIIKRK